MKDKKDLKKNKKNLYCMGIKWHDLSYEAEKEEKTNIYLVANHEENKVKITSQFTYFEFFLMCKVLSNESNKF